MCVVGIVGTALRLSHFSTPQSSVWRVFVFVDIWCCSVCTLAHRNTHTECTGLIQHGGVTQHWVWYSSRSRLRDTYPLESTGLLLVGYFDGARAARQRAIKRETVEKVQPVWREPNAHRAYVRSGLLFWILPKLQRNVFPVICFLLVIPLHLA